MKTAKEMVEFLVFLSCFYFAGNLIAFLAAVITVIFVQK